MGYDSLDSETVCRPNCQPAASVSDNAGTESLTAWGCPIYTMASGGVSPLIIHTTRGLTPPLTGYFLCCRSPNSMTLLPTRILSPDFNGVGSLMRSSFKYVPP